MTLPLDHARLVVSADALLTVARAAQLLGDRGARAWIEKNVPLRYVAGKPRVKWGDILDASLLKPPPPKGGKREHPGLVRADW